MRLRLFAPLPAVEATAADRLIAGLALPYGVIGHTTAGPITVRAGAVNLPGDIRRVILFREHGRTTPVGHATAAAEDRNGLRLVFRAAATPDGDRALVEAAEHVRDALSVELDNAVLDAAGNVQSADLTAVALTSIPAFSDARIAASASDPDDAAGADDPNGDNVPDDPNTPPTTPPTPPAPTDPPPAPADPPAGDAAPPATPPAGPVTAARGSNTRSNAGTIVAAAPGSRRPGRRGLSLSAAMRHVVTMIGESNDANTINAALSDITPAADTSDGAFIRPQWIDELWTPIDVRRPYAASISSGELTGMKVFGWKWGTRPVVGPYAGNKTPIPSGPVTFGPAEATAVRHAGGWDVDNIFVYLGDASLLRAILDAAALDYAMKLEASVSAALVAEATAATAADLTEALSVAASTLAAAGARPSFVAVASDLWGSFVGMPASEAPWWLASTSASSVNLTDSTAAAADLRVFVDPSLAAGHVLAGDRRAATLYEPRGNPFRVQAVNLPNGGVDIGVFGFSATLVNDDRGIVDVTVGPVIP